MKRYQAEIIADAAMDTCNFKAEVYLASDVDNLPDDWASENWRRRAESAEEREVALRDMVQQAIHNPIGAVHKRLLDFMKEMRGEATIWRLMPDEAVATLFTKVLFQKP
jgi:hypothetical protein